MAWKESFWYAFVFLIGACSLLHSSEDEDSEARPYSWAFPTPKIAFVTSDWKFKATEYQAGDSISVGFVATSEDQQLGWNGVFADIYTASGDTESVYVLRTRINVFIIPFPVIHPNRAGGNRLISAAAVKPIPNNNVIEVVSNIEAITVSMDPDKPGTKPPLIDTAVIRKP